MVEPKVTVTIGTRTVPLSEVTDSRIRTAFQAVARDVGQKIGRVLCPEHKRTATNVRLHFDKNAAADLQYDSCCAALGEAIGKALG